MIDIKNKRPRRPHTIDVTNLLCFNQKQKYFTHTHTNTESSLIWWIKKIYYSEWCMCMWKHRKKNLKFSSLDCTRVCVSLTCIETNQIKLNIDFRDFLPLLFFYEWTCTTNDQRKKPATTTHLSITQFNSNLVWNACHTINYSHQFTLCVFFRCKNKFFDTKLTSNT